MHRVKVHAWWKTKPPRECGERKKGEQRERERERAKTGEKKNLKSDLVTHETI